MLPSGNSSAAATPRRNSVSSLTLFGSGMENLRFIAQSSGALSSSVLLPKPLVLPAQLIIVFHRGAFRRRKGFSPSADAGAGGSGIEAAASALSNALSRLLRLNTHALRAEPVMPSGFSPRSQS